MFAIAYTYSAGSVTEFGIVMTPNTFSLNEKVKGGFLAQGICRASGENDVSHEGFEYDPPPNADYLSILKGLANAYYCPYRLLTNLYNGVRRTIPIACYPGYSHHNVKEVTSSTSRNRYECTATSGGNAAEVTRVNTTWFTDKRFKIETSRMRFIVVGSAGRYKIQVSTAYRILSLAADGTVIQDIDNPFSPYLDLKGTFEVDIPYRDVGSQVRTLVSASMHTVLKSASGRNSYDIHSLLQQASNDAYNGMKKTSVNTAMYMTDMTTLLGTIESFKTLVINPTKPSSWASAYLGMKWGIKSQVRDTYSLMNDLQKRYSNKHKGTYATRGAASSHFVGYYGVVYVTGHVKIRYSPKPGWAMDTIRTGLEWGYWPSFKNTVDFIPFSFICNWFSNMNDVLQQIDNNVYAEYQNIYSSLNSVKLKANVPLSKLVPDLPLSTEVSFSRYTRWLSDSAYAPKVPTLDLENPNATNAVDGGSLIIQRFGKK